MNWKFYWRVKYFNQLHSRNSHTPALFNRNTLRLSGISLQWGSASKALWIMVLQNSHVLFQSTRNWKFILSNFIFIFSFIRMNAQDSLQKKIKEVTITEKKLIPTPSAAQKYDSTLLLKYSTSNLQNLLQLHSNVFVKNYGINSLSTISIRGSSAAQTSVNWYGVNINQATTGISDFSAIPAGLFNQIQINYGHEQDEFNIGGSIQLKNENVNFKPRKQFKFDVGFESILNAGMLASYLKSNNRISNQVKVYVFNGLNKYNYFNDEINEHTILKHASSKQIGFMNDFAWQRKPANIIECHTWLQTLQRQIPPASFEWESAKIEHSFSVKNIFLSRWKINSKWKVNSTFAQLLDSYHYSDSLSQINATSKSIQLPFCTSLLSNLSKKHFIKINATAISSILLNKKPESLNKVGIGVQYSMTKIFNFFNADFFVQKEFTNLFKVPLSAKFSLNSNKLKHLVCNVTISQQVRIPTLNELYFEPGGNLQLKPEQSKSFEAGLLYNYKSNHWEIETDATLFYRRVENWIAWFGNAILTPHNIQEVQSKGLDCIASVNYRFPNHPSIRKINSCILYAYTIATTVKSIISNDYSIGKQIPYVPRYQLKAKLGIVFNRIEFECWQTYTGYRFVTSDESEYLKPYFNTNMFSSFLVDKKNKLRCTIRLNNMFNHYYESTVGRIMPGRNLSLGFQFKIIE
jgi:vitamin B12 transporter